MKSKKIKGKQLANALCRALVLSKMTVQPLFALPKPCLFASSPEILGE